MKLGTITYLTRAIEAGLSLAPDARQGKLLSGTFTLSGVPGSPTTISIPGGSRGFRLYPYSGTCRFGIDEAPQTVGSNALTKGGNARENEWEVRLLDPDAITLYLASQVNNLVVEVEFF